MTRRTILTMLSSLALTVVMGLAFSGCGGGEDAAGTLNPDAAKIGTQEQNEDARKKLESMRGGYAPPGVNIPKKKSQ